MYASVFLLAVVVRQGHRPKYNVEAKEYSKIQNLKISISLNYTGESSLLFPSAQQEIVKHHKLRSATILYLPHVVDSVGLDIAGVPARVVAPHINLIANHKVFVLIS